MTYFNDFADEAHWNTQRELRKALKIAMKALDEIADPTSAYHIAGRPRNLSYADWELRGIANVALQQIAESGLKTSIGKD